MPSTAIGKIDYDLDKQLLFIDFVTNGRRYAYLGVKPETYAAFRNAFAKGTYFNDHIRDRFECELVYDPNWGKARLAS